MEWLKKAADGGEVFGLTHYGVHLLEGDLRPHDVNEGFRYLKLAADRSSSAAMWAVATLYVQWRGCERDLAKAADYAERAMEIGDPDLTREAKRRLNSAPGLREELDRRSKSRSKSI
jgi:TPR repeat protein